MEMRNGEEAGLDPGLGADASLAAAEVLVAVERSKDLAAAVADMAIWGSGVRICFLGFWQLK